MDKEKIIKELEKFYKRERKEFIGYCNERQYQDYGFDSGEDMLDCIESEGNVENTVWEQGYLGGINDTIELLKNKI